MKSPLVKQLYRFLSPNYQNVFLDYPVTSKPRYGSGLPPHPELYRIIDAQREQYRNVLEFLLQFKERFWEIQTATNEKNLTKPVWNNGYFPGLDIITLYTLISMYKPEKYLEIGSGNSTKVAFKAIQEQKLSTQIISIDPQPRAEIDQLAHLIVRAPFETVDFTRFDTLQANDILFVDNSHRILPNSDSMVFYLEVLPRIKKGVIIHIHDVYLPYDYPQFMCDRYYSEQYGLAMYLLANPSKYQPLLPNFFISEDPELSSILNSVWEHPNLKGVERHGGSFWFRIAE
jgi:hypothetical protein